MVTRLQPVNAGHHSQEQVSLPMSLFLPLSLPSVYLNAPLSLKYSTLSFRIWSVSHSLFPTFESALNLFFKLLNSLCLIPFICVCPPVTPDGELTTPLLRPVPAYPFLHRSSEEEHHSHF